MSKTKVVLARAVNTSVPAITKLMTQIGGDATQALVDIRIARAEQQWNREVEDYRTKIADLTRVIERDQKELLAAAQAMFSDIKGKLEVAAASVTGSGLFGAVIAKSSVTFPTQPGSERTVHIIYNLEFKDSRHYNIQGSESRQFSPEANLIYDRQKATEASKAAAETALNQVRVKLSKIPTYERQIKAFIGERRIKELGGDQGAELLAELDQLQLN